MREDHSERNSLIRERVARGDPIKCVAEDYGISHERVRQICKPPPSARPHTSESADVAAQTTSDTQTAQEA